MKDLWDSRFKTNEYVYGEEPNKYFKDKISTLHPGKVLLLADGEGRNGVYAAKLGWEVVSVDYSEEAKKKALKLAANNNVSISYKVADLNNFQIEADYFDLVVLIFAHFDENLRIKVHKLAQNALKDGGHIILQAYDKEQLGNTSGGPKKIELLYSLEELFEDFQDLEFVEFEKKNISIKEGNLHQGEAVVVQLFARK